MERGLRAEINIYDDANLDIYDLVMENEYIYGLMYGLRVEFHTLEEDIIKIETKKLKWAKDKNAFYYVWGWPGPDFSRYAKEDYCITWALSKQTLLNYWNFK